jgi:hypothetical protein
VASHDAAHTAQGVGARQPPDHDGDGDAHGSPAFFDPDDEVVHYGHAASGADGRAISALVKRYYTAAAANDGAAVCSLIETELAAALSHEYVRKSASPSTASASCPEAVSSLLHQNLQWSPADVAAMKVADIRVDGKHALALLDLHSADYQILLEREGGAWRFAELFDSEVR